MRLTLPVRIIGVDIDTKNVFVVGANIKKMKEVGKIIYQYETRKGWHFKVKLNKPCGFKKSIQLRSYVGDDWLRCYFDILRRWKGSKYNDILYNDKKKI